MDNLLLSLLLFFILFDLMSALPRGGAVFGKGGVTEAVFGNYASPPEYKTSETFVLYNIPIWGWFLIALPIMGVVIICLALTVWNLLSMSPNLITTVLELTPKYCVHSVSRKSKNTHGNMAIIE